MTSRFLFIDKEKHKDNRIGHLLQLNFCFDCQCPKDFQSHIVYPGWVSGKEQCFICGKIFDGNTAAHQILIELDSDNLDYKGNKI